MQQSRDDIDVEGAQIKLEEALNKNGSRAERESNGRRPSERRAEEGGIRGVHGPRTGPNHTRTARTENYKLGKRETENCLKFFGSVLGWFRFWYKNFRSGTILRRFQNGSSVLMVPRFFWTPLGGLHRGNLLPLLATQLGRSEYGQPLQSTLTFEYKGNQPLTNLGGNLSPNGTRSPDPHGKQERPHYKEKSTEEAVNEIGEITFPALGSDNSSDPVIIRVRISKRQVNRVYMDSESSCEVVYENCFLKLKPSIRLSPVPEPYTTTPYPFHTSHVPLLPNPAVKSEHFYWTRCIKPDQEVKQPKDKIGLIPLLNKHKGCSWIARVEIHVHILHQMDG
nr:hypothetical protein [Tanacetum cinerariifolium]GEX80927.1 hypothetical protein [Tanacetum cinerariifolium]